MDEQVTDQESRADQKEPAYKEPAYTVNQSVEVWFAGWDQWQIGRIESVGFFDGFPCALVQLDGAKEVHVYRQDQLQAVDGLFA